MRLVLCLGLLLLAPPAMAEIMEELDRDDPFPIRAPAVVPETTVHNCPDQQANNLRNMAIDADGYATTFMMQGDFVQATYYSSQAETYRHQARERCAQFLHKKVPGK